ncbi:hypothetical protein [Flavobacterium sp. FlaQc-47]|uniref:hypothetical protein n=1 Tax=Flavobacterium sp. FlaQc-47 TaxID=3374180 RepID=UPI003756B3E0
MKQLTLERRQIKEERTRIKNQLHAEEAEAMPDFSSIEHSKRRIVFLNTLEKEIKNEIEGSIKENKELAKDIINICTIPGV